MPVERESGSSSLIDVLDRILDKGIVVDPWARILPGGISLAGTASRMVVAPMDNFRNAALASPTGNPDPDHARAAGSAPTAKLIKVFPQRRPGRKHGHG